MVVGVTSALALTLSSPIVDRMGVSTALLWFVPGLILLSAVAWIPMFRVYLQDRDTLHKLLTQRQEDLLRR